MGVALPTLRAYAYRAAEGANGRAISIVLEGWCAGSVDGDGPFAVAVTQAFM